MKVRATDKYDELNLQDIELKRIPKQGEEWEVSEERYKVLTQTNKYNTIFVEKVEEIETATKNVKTEKAIRKTRKKKENDL